MRTLPDWADHTIVGRGRETMHARWGAYADRQAAVAGANSPWVRSLDGEWAFLLVPRPEAAPEDFMTPDFADDSWTRLMVPGNWELHGHGEALYANIAYPFPPDPPHPPVDNPTGCYRRTFVLPTDWAGRRVFLEFGSVDSSFHLWVNGIEVGYSTDSKLTSCFEITDKLHRGENLIALRVYRWGTSAYLEKQDYWHLSGIQRSVRLLAKPQVHLRDWFVQTECHPADDSAQVVVRAWINKHESPVVLLPSGMIDYPRLRDWKVSVQLLSPDGTPCAELIAPVATRSPMYGSDISGAGRQEAFSAVVSLSVPRALWWSPEAPHLYTMVLELLNPEGKAVDWERQRVGIRTVDIKDSVVRLNGRRLVVRGINRHEFDPRRGRVLTEADMCEDIIRMKRLNFNAVRTCHYPNDERWYELCDELGLAVVDEANLETHGVEALLSHDPSWATAYLERVVRMVLRDRNYSSVLVWSLGNESSVGPNHAAMAGWLREADPTRPVQYESGSPGPAISDILAPMYPSLTWVSEVLADSRERRPMILCEYAYAKGNASGNIREFWDLVWRLPRLQGGFVWDWRDKALQTEDGACWEYGKKVDEVDHVERMCLSGIMGPDLVEHPGAWEVKIQQAPVFAWASEQDLVAGLVRVQNRHSFLNLNILCVNWAVKEDALLVAEGSVVAPSCEPMASTTVELPLPATSPAPGSTSWLEVRFVLDREQPWASRGHEVYAAQFQLPWQAPPAPIRSPGSMPRVLLTEHNGLVRLSTALGGITFERASGSIVSLMTGPRELLTRPLVGCFVRAPTDIDYAIGDCGIAERWKNAGFDHLNEVVESFEIACLSPALVRLKISILLATNQRAARIRRETVYLVYGSGDLRIEEALSVNAPVESVARLGLTVSLNSEFTTLRWYGRGPFENYPDRKDAALVGIYTASVRDLLTPYVFPQENALRCDVRWAALSAVGGAGLLVQGLPRFHFSALPVTDIDLRTAGNLADLRLRDEVTLHIDGFHMGVGGDNGWSINVHPEYCLPPGRYRYAVRLRPLHAGDEPGALCREFLDESPERSAT